MEMKVFNKEELTSLVDRMCEKVCPALGVTKEEVFSRNRKHEIVWARDIMYLALRDRYSLSQIGDHFGYDHSTVYHGTVQIQNIFLTEKVLIPLYDACLELVTNIDGIPYHEVYISFDATAIYSRTDDSVTSKIDITFNGTHTMSITPAELMRLLYFKLQKV